MAHIIRAAPGYPDIPEGFPILMDESMQILEPFHLYLIDEIALNGRSLSAETVRAYSEHLLDWADSLEQMGIAWDDVSKQTLARYRDRHLKTVSPRTGRPYSPLTINARIGTVCRFYKWAHKKRWIEQLPFDVVSVRRWARQETFLPQTEGRPGYTKANSMTVPTPSPVRRGLSPAEIRLLFQNLDMPYFLMAKWALWTGMRRMEVCGLTWTQIPESMHLRQRDHQLLGVPLTITKGNEPRDAYVPLQLLDETHRYIDGSRRELIRKKKQRKRHYRPPSALFLGIRGQAIAKDCFSRACRNAYRKAKVRADLHCLRHTYAIRTLDILTRAANAGEPINPLLYLKEMLGHASIASTLIYLASLQIKPETVLQNIEYLYGEVIGDDDFGVHPKLGTTELLSLVGNQRLT